MNDMLNSLEGFDSGSNYKFGDKMDVARPSRSLFDLSHLNTLTINNAGTLIPIALWETVPNDDFDINVDCLLRVMPQVVPLYSRQRLYVYGFYSRYSDLWNHWQVFIDKGYTGNVNKTIPELSYKNYAVHTNETNKIPADSLMDYLGIPIGVSEVALFGNPNDHSDSYAHISALPNMMYLRIYRDYFMNKNEWINDRVLLPDDDSRFRLDDDGCLLSAKDENKNFYFWNQTTDEQVGDEISIDSGNYYQGLLYHDYPDDYFTSALPFTQRGNTPELKYSINTSALGLDFTGSFKDFENPSVNSLTGLTTYSDSTGDYLAGGEFKYNSAAGVDGVSVHNEPTVTAKMLNAFNRGKVIGDSIGLKITLENIRELAIKQLELEKMARTDGSYKQFGLSFFGEVSKAAYDYRPTYIGGTYKNLVFTEVLQTAGSTVPTTAESGNSPLGAYSGHGISGITKGRIGHIHCDDFGMIMLIACIMPDVYYCQGLDRIFTDSLESDKYKPERARLGMQPILNKELYYAGNNGNDIGEDNYLWAYQNPYDWLRYIPNKIHGKIADKENKSFYPYTQARKFTQLPNWGYSFSEAKSVRKDYLYSSSEDAYTAQFSMNIRAVRPIPYKASPAQILN